MHMGGKIKMKIGRGLFRLPEIAYRLYFSRKLRLKYIAYIQKPFVLHCENNIVIGNSFAAQAGCRIETYEGYSNNSVKIIIGDNVTLNYRTHIGAINYVEIGDGTLTGSDVLIVDHNHGENKDLEELNIRPRMRPLYSPGPVIIGENVWIGDKACILPAVKIGNNSIIGAGSIVTHDIPEDCIAAGNPARIIKDLRKR